MIEKTLDRDTLTAEGPGIRFDRKYQDRDDAEGI